MNKLKVFMNEVIVSDLTDVQKKVISGLLEGDKIHCVYGRLHNFNMMEFLINCRNRNDERWKIYCGGMRDNGD